MEKNKQYLKEDTFIKKYLQEVSLDEPKSNFTNAIMDVILAEEKKTVAKPEPIISKKMWLLSIGFIASCLLFLLKGESTSGFSLPKLDMSFLSAIKMPNLFVSLPVSSTMFYAIIVFSVMVFVQIVYLKNHFNKRFD